jgi:phage terminase large subunit-like protein
LVVADTLADARTINAEGPSGILNVLNRRKVDHRYKQSPRPMVLFPDGAKIYLEGADDPDTGRGYNSAGVLCDEMAKWQKPYETWYEGLLPSLRADLIDDHPRAFVTTTPKPINLLIEWLAREDGTIHVITGSTFDNAPNLSAHALRELKIRYHGTALGEQELYGKLLELASGGLFRRMDIVKSRVPYRPDQGDIVSTVVGMDPNLTGEEALTGLVVVCRTTDNHQYVLADRTVEDSGRHAALAAWRAVAEFGADLLVYEENLGKRYLQEVLQDAYLELVEQGTFPKGTSPPMKPVHARHGKKTRAEPVAMRCEQGKLHIVGEQPDLENQMVLYDPQSTRESPDRMDALVHASIYLMVGEKRQMRVSDPSQYDFRLDQSLYDLNRLL